MLPVDEACGCIGGIRGLRALGKEFDGIVRGCASDMLRLLSANVYNGCMYTVKVKIKVYRM